MHLKVNYGLSSSVRSLCICQYVKTYELCVIYVCMKKLITHVKIIANKVNYTNSEHQGLFAQ